MKEFVADWDCDLEARSEGVSHEADTDAESVSVVVGDEDWDTVTERVCVKVKLFDVDSEGVWVKLLVTVILSLTDTLVVSVAVPVMLAESLKTRLAEEVAVEQPSPCIRKTRRGRSQACENDPTLSGN